MQLTKALKYLVVGLSAISVAEATFADVRRVGRDGKMIQRRQDDEEDTGDKDTPTTTSDPPPAETTTTSDEPTETSTTPTVTQTPTQTATQTSTEAPPTSSSSSSSSQQEDGPSSTSSDDSPDPTTAPETSSTDNNDDGDSQPTKGPDESQSVEVSTITQIRTITNADGSQSTVTSKTVTTAPPSLANNDGNTQESGMSTQTRNTVIGVVVGVGGAIILGGLAFVAWRIWGRKRNQEENDVLMDYHSGVEKPESGGSMGGRTPFQSTLESYHAPTQVNTAANF